VEGIQANHLDLARYIVDDYQPFDPAHPDPPEAFKASRRPRPIECAAEGDPAGAPAK